VFNIFYYFYKNSFWISLAATFDNPKEIKIILIKFRDADDHLIYLKI